MFKGVTTIELTDINTGEKQVVEDTNFFTNAYAHLCQPILRNGSNFPYAYSIHSSGIERTVEELTGGLLLFDESLGEDPNTFFPPQGVTMVGHGSDFAYNGTELSLGSYNFNLSDTTELKTKKYVWDFNAEQGNGTIASVCLTNKWGGAIGYGSKEFLSAELNNFSLGTSYLRCMDNYRVARYSIYHELNSYYVKPVYLSFKDDYIVLFDMLLLYTGILQFERVHFWTRKEDLFGRHNTISEYNQAKTSIFNGLTQIERITLDLKTTINSLSRDDACNFHCVDGKYLYLSASSNGRVTWGANEPRTFVKVNLEDFTYETFTMRNTTGESIKSPPYTSSAIRQGNSMAVCNGYAFFLASSGKIFAINISDNTNVRQIFMSDGEPALASSYITNVKNDCLIVGKNFNGMVTLCTKEAGLRKNSGSSALIYPLMCINTNDFLLRGLGMANVFWATYTTGISDCHYGNVCDTDDPLYFCNVTTSGSGATSVDGSSSYLNVNICVYAPFLMTINNLAEPVTKTAAQTMRVTYTITKQE